MKRGTLSSLDAVIGPKDLGSVVEFDRFEWRGACMAARKRTVAHRVPVLGQNNMIELFREAVDYRDNLVTLRNLQRASRTKVVLDIDDQKKVALCHLEIFLG